MPINFNASPTPIASIVYEYPQSDAGRVLDITPNPVITVTYADGAKNVFDTNLIFNRGYEVGLKMSGNLLKKSEKPFDLYDQPGYQEMMTNSGYNVLAWETFGDYQGDYAAVLSNGMDYGFTVIGYGSCSGCDALEGCDTQEEYDTLMESVRNNIFWGNQYDVRNKILNSFDDNNWYRSDAGFNDSVMKLLKAVK